MGAYAEAYRHSLADPSGFWAEQAKAIDWFTAPKTILSSVPVGPATGAAELDRWFADGVLNTSYNALDRHVIKGRAEQDALIFHSAITGARRTYSYAELLEKVARLAGGLAGLGVTKGDRVVIYLPMIPEAVMAMLACARIGAVHSVVFGGFAPAELASRIDDARPKVVISASCGLEANRVVEYKPLLDAALARSSHQPAHCIVLQREQVAAAMVEPRDLDFAALMRSGLSEPAPVTEVAATDPLYILYTSGATGRPKGIVRDNGGHAVAVQWAMRNIVGLGPGEVIFTASDVGWVVGHSFGVYGPLLVGATTVLYEGRPVGTPDAGSFWRVVDEHRVKTVFSAPTAIRSIRKADPEGELIRNRDLSSLSSLFLTGERLDPDTYAWASRQLGVLVVDNWWQTETGWPIASVLPGLEPMTPKPGSVSVPVPGFDVAILDRKGRERGRGSEGTICLRHPLPPGVLSGLWGGEDEFAASYLERFPGFYVTGDGGYRDEDGYLYVMGRIDDVINVAGHRLTTGAMEAVLTAHPAVAECAVIGVADELEGQIPRALVVLVDGADVDRDTIGAELVALVRSEIGEVAGLRRVDVVEALPKTRSGKVLRKTMREIADGEPGRIPASIEDLHVIEQVRSVLHP